MLRRSRLLLDVRIIVDHLQPRSGYRRFHALRQIGIVIAHGLEAAFQRGGLIHLPG
jgi:hypothetical protein